jgi:hypothetical protein
MNFTKGEVCYWELFVDPNEFLNKHSFAVGHLSEIYINLAFDVVPSNLQKFVLQGESKYNATSKALTTVNTRFSLASGSRILLIAFPTSAAIPSQSMLTFTYNLTTDYYPVKGLDAQLKAEVAPDLDNTGYWYPVLIISALIFLGMLIAMFTVCCKDYDPLTDFERRRKISTKEQKDAERKAKKEAEKAAKKSAKAGKAKGKFSNIEDEG